MQPASLGGDLQVPVFLFPTGLNFYLDSAGTHQQVFTVYNPNQIALKYRVFCTALNKYRVSDPEGVIQPKEGVEIKIKHLDLRSEHFGIVDKFRVNVYERGQREVIGRNVITSVLHRSKPILSPQQFQDDKFESIPPSPLNRPRLDYESSNVATNRRASGAQAQPRAEQAKSPSWMIVVMGILALIVLALPLQGDTDTSIPEYLHFSHQWKLVASFFFGLATFSVFFSTL